MKDCSNKYPGRRTDTTRPAVHRLTWIQLSFTVAIAGVGYLFAGQVAGYSGLLGGLIYTIPNAFFTRQVFAYRPAGAMGHIVRAFYWGEVIKLALTALLFAAVFKWVQPLNAGVLFLAFILVLTTNTLAPALWGPKSLKNRA
nr:ATP synthase subunit I [Marinobacter halodurans]